MIIELFSLGVTAEALRAKIDCKSAISLQRGHFDPKFQVEGDASLPIIFAWIVRPMNATLPLTVFTRINFDFLQAKCDFRRKMAVLRSRAPLGDLGATYDDYLRLESA